MPAFPHAVYRLALSRAKRWLKRSDVVGVAVGHRSRRGKYHRHRCIIVTVTDKLPHEELRRRGRRPLPTHIAVTYQRKPYVVPVDVDNSDGQNALVLNRLAAQPIFDSNSFHIGAAALAVSRGNTLYLLTAAHVTAVAAMPRFTVGPTRAPARLRNPATDVAFGNSFDHALLTPDQPILPDASVLPDGNRLSGLRAITPYLIGRPAFFHRSVDGARVLAYVRKTDGFVPVSVNGTVEYFGPIIAADPLTVDGDSGTLLYDSSLLGLGTLLGSFAGNSCFLGLALSCARLGITPQL